jgi:hypothetical protein
VPVVHHKTLQVFIEVKQVFSLQFVQNFARFLHGQPQIMSNRRNVSG